MKLGEAMYKTQQAEAGGASGGEQPHDDVIDAEFKDVGDEK
jgi:molecular chaperone DnaK